MPGILPMKVIKVGNSTQSRVAQACDRCRSKKIRCDGIRPCCSQCANVGFECKTSDKLSRRAFPRGYTESLEERVRALEAEVRELKCLLDEKDEKIDVLSRLHPSSPTSKKSPSRSTAGTAKERSNSVSTQAHRDDLIHVQSALSLRKPTQDCPFMGPSSTRAFIDAFTSKLESSGKPTASVSIDTVISPPSPSVWPRQDFRPKIPPRLVSDQLLNIFFQEWAPLYPVVHRPSILKLYGRYTTNPETVGQERYALVLLNLIFGIAAASSSTRVPQDPLIFEQNWIAKLEALSNDISLPALQCFILAQIYYSLKPDYKALLRYRSLAVAICLQLGLHQSQKRFPFNPLVSETRKRVFWCQYSLDRFAAALTGLPVLMAESDICTEYPSDVDDEHLTEAGFAQTPEDGTTRISSALALFSASRILSKVLQELYPSPAGYEISLPTMHALAEELDDWLKKLPSHLRLEFVQDKPSASVTSSRSPLLSMVYYFIRTLIRRPAACYGKPESASPSMLSLVDSAKHILQLLKLLEERRMSMSLSINKRELIFLCGLGLLWQSMDLTPDSKLIKEGQKSLNVAMSLLECESAEASAALAAIVNGISPEEVQKRPSNENIRVPGDIPSSPSRDQSHNNQLLQPMNARFSFSPESDMSAYSKDNVRRTNFIVSSPELSRSVRSSSSHSVSSEMGDRPKRPRSESSGTALGMDYLQLESEKKHAPPTMDDSALQMSHWEHVLSNMDNGHANIYNGIYGGGECGETPATFATLAASYQQPAQPTQQQQQPQQHPHQHQHQQQHQHQHQQHPHQQHPHSSSVSVIQSAPQHGWPSGGGWPTANGNVPPPDGKSRGIPGTQPGMLDAYEAIVIPHNMDTLNQNGGDFTMTDSWIQQCSM